MALTREQKAVAVEALQEKLRATPTIYLTDYAGLTVEQANTLRNRFREAGVEFRVIKNTLLRLAMEKVGGYEELFDHLHGPTAVAFSEEPAAPARVIKRYLEETSLERPALKGAFVDGAVFHEDALEALAALKSKDELIGDILGLLLAPITNVVGGLQAQGGNLVGALKTIAERGEA
ncbi:50S ribosomal protein L10 [Rhodocaloribacter litoris]|uniref:50S ribosomal protein L10 n=1 Tax=Rhodocaloribacter litoris TaxID=2558931 RepID=UPI001423A9AD|nr:50S ribosomal protein L10 [Rhodocaloribacter litoris]QXD15172.1 50S ribosomal protein L10 [Rhodocaloribacter litoris]GIV60464.1 MAG: 50S ribosomal protein L10 [Rhodothermaceae bacterium]